MKAHELIFAIGYVVALGRQDVVISSGRYIGDHHTVFDPLFQVDVFIERDVRPVVDQLDLAVRRANAVDPAEALDDAHRIPVNVIIDQKIAVLKVLPLGDTVGSD